MKYPSSELGCFPKAFTLRVAQQSAIKLLSTIISPKISFLICIDLNHVHRDIVECDRQTAMRSIEFRIQLNQREIASLKGEQNHAHAHHRLARKQGNPKNVLFLQKYADTSNFWVALLISMHKQQLRGLRRYDRKHSDLNVDNDSEPLSVPKIREMWSKEKDTAKRGKMAELHQLPDIVNPLLVRILRIIYIIARSTIKSLINSVTFTSKRCCPQHHSNEIQLRFACVCAFVFLRNWLLQCIFIANFDSERVIRRSNQHAALDRRRQRPKWRFQQAHNSTMHVKNQKSAVNLLFCNFVFTLQSFFLESPRLTGNVFRSMQKLQIAQEISQKRLLTSNVTTTKFACTFNCKSIFEQWLRDAINAAVHETIFVKTTSIKVRLHCTSRMIQQRANWKSKTFRDT